MGGRTTERGWEKKDKKEKKICLVIEWKQKYLTLVETVGRKPADILHWFFCNWIFFPLSLIRELKRKFFVYMLPNFKHWYTTLWLDLYTLWLSTAGCSFPSGLFYKMAKSSYGHIILLICKRQKSFLLLFL